MTNEEAVRMLKAKLACFSMDVSGCYGECNEELCDECPLNYEQGNMGEQKEYIRMSIEALERESCNDAISRQAVIDVTWEEPSYTDALNVLTEVRDKVKALSPVNPQEPKTDWIPVSERLPEIHQDVLLSFRSLDVEVGFRGETEPYYYCNGYYVEPKNVLAWQPLPEPYKAERSKE